MVNFIGHHHARAILFTVAFVTAIAGYVNPSPSEILCFATHNSSYIHVCGNKINSTCIINMMPASHKGFYSKQCTTDSKVIPNIPFISKHSHKLCKKQNPNILWASVVVRNDAYSMVEWLTWHLLIGFQHILVYDNDSTDNLYIAIKPFIDAGMVEYIPNPGKDVQIKACNLALQKCRENKVTWLAVFDLDEYIVPLSTSCILDFFTPYKNNNDISAIHVSWHFVPSNGKISRYSLFPNNTPPSNIRNQSFITTIENSLYNNIRVPRANMHIKAIYKVSNTISGAVHAGMYKKGTHPILSNGNRAPEGKVRVEPVSTHLVMLHLQSRTLEEWVMKRERGRADELFRREDMTDPKWKRPAVTATTTVSHSDPSLKGDVLCTTCFSPLEIMVAEWRCILYGGKLTSLDPATVACIPTANSLLELIDVDRSKVPKNPAVRDISEKIRHIITLLNKALLEKNLQ
eukprot:gene8710-17997_t